VCREEQHVRSIFPRPAVLCCCAPKSKPQPPNCHRTQNPNLVRVKEGISRGEKRVKAGEKELGKLRAAHQEQLAKIAKMEEQLQALEDGEHAGHALICWLPTCMQACMPLGSCCLVPRCLLIDACGQGAGERGIKRAGRGLPSLRGLRAGFKCPQGQPSTCQQDPGFCLAPILLRRLNALFSRSTCGLLEVKSHSLSHLWVRMTRCPAILNKQGDPPCVGFLQLPQMGGCRSN
jgi:hypothetical protein